MPVSPSRANLAILYLHSLALPALAMEAPTAIQMTLYRVSPREPEVVIDQANIASKQSPSTERSSYLAPTNAGVRISASNPAVRSPVQDVSKLRLLYASQ